MSEISKLAAKYEKAINDESVQDSEFFNIQKSTLRSAMNHISEHPDAPDPDADYLVGIIGLADGDRYQIPVNNIMGHLLRAYKNGHASAGIHLYKAHDGLFPIVPEQMRNVSKGLLILETLAEDRFAHAAYELVGYYFSLIDTSNGAGEVVPESYYHQTMRYIQEAIDLEYSGGFLAMGVRNFYGFYGLVEKNQVVAYQYFERGLDAIKDTYFEHNIHRTLLHWKGTCLFSGEGVSMNRLQGIENIKKAASMGYRDSIEWLENNKTQIDLITSSTNGEDVVFYNLGDIEFSEFYEDNDMTDVLPTEESAGETRENPMTFFSQSNQDPDPARPIIKKKPTTH